MVLRDGFCVIRAIQEGLSFCYNENHKLCGVKAVLRSEMLRNCNEYSAFSSDKADVLTVLDRFLSNPLQYCNSDTVDLFFIVLGNTLRKMSPYSELFWSAFFWSISFRIHSECVEIREKCEPE